jgi:hypothetical protein
MQANCYESGIYQSVTRFLDKSILDSFLKRTCYYFEKNTTDPILFRHFK